MQTAEGKLYLSVASDRTSTFAVVQVASKTGRTSASAFLSALIDAVPDTIHTVLTDNGIPFTVPSRYADGPAARHMTPMFDRRCRENGIEHRLTKVKHPWTHAQVDRMNRTTKEAIVTRFHDDDHAPFEAYRIDFIAASTFGRRRKTLRGLTPYEDICTVWTAEPDRFRLDPIHQMTGLNTWSTGLSHFPAYGSGRSAQCAVPLSPSAESRLADDPPSNPVHARYHQASQEGLKEMLPRRTWW